MRRASCACCDAYAHLLFFFTQVSDTRSHCADNSPCSSPSPTPFPAQVSDTKVLETDDEVVATIKELLETRVRPAVQVRYIAPYIGPYIGPYLPLHGPLSKSTRVQVRRSTCLEAPSVGIAHSS